MRAVRHSPVAFQVALLALLCQLLAVLPGRASPASASWASHICAAAPVGAAPHAPAPTHPDCVHCPLCAGLASPVAVLAPTGSLPGPLTTRRVRFAVGAGQATHRPAIVAARPRGPPILT